MRPIDPVRTIEPPSAESHRAFWDRPTTIAMILGWAAMLIFTFHACTHMVAAGDTWVAMACGRHFVNHGVDTVEPFSANSHKPGPTPEEVKRWPGWARWITDKVGLGTVRYWHPTGWVNQNWLTHVIFYRLTTALGTEAEPYYDALVLWKFGIYLLAAVALYFTARIYGVPQALAAVSVCFALYIGRSFLDIRPAGFSNLLVAVLILVMALASYKNALYIWLIVPLIVFWANVHGGYIYAFIVLVPFVVWHLIMNLPRRWTIAAYGIVLWLALYALSNRLYRHEFLTPTPILKDGLFYLVLLAFAGSAILSYSKRMGDGVIIAYHLAVSCVLFLVFLPRFFPVMPVGLNIPAKEDLKIYIVGARLAYLGIFTFAMILSAVVILVKEKMVQVMDTKGVLHTLGAGATAFVAMVIFNPFHLTNLTHTFVISVSKHAERWRDVQEWNRAFDWRNPVGTAYPFLAMYVLAWLALLAWALVLVRMSQSTGESSGRRFRKSADYEWRKTDLALLVIGALTVYMAIRSRRFIPIAGFVACPLVALLVDQAVRMIAALIRSPQAGRLEVPSMPRILQWSIVLLGAVVVVPLGIYWGLKFKSVYLDSLPADPKYTSVFMRMTYSYPKPFAACEFIRRNKLRGNMFNYWTEGGFIAWGQDPDPQTGQIPLKLFMDGRAQAAYDVKAFDRWTKIFNGEPIVRRAMTTRGKLTVKDYIEVGEWVEEQLRKSDVWVALMPYGQFDHPFTVGLEYSEDWRVVFLSEKEKLLVDINSPKGLRVFQDVLTGKAIYPDEYSANLTRGYNLLMFPDMAQKKRGLDLIIKAFNGNPSPAPAREMFRAARFADLRPQIDQVCEQYVREFEKNKKVYAGQDGYNLRLEAARIALARLAQVAKANGDSKLVSVYNAQIERHLAEQEAMADTNRW